MCFDILDLYRKLDVPVVINFPGPTSLVEKAKILLVPYIYFAIGPIIFNVPWSEAPKTKAVAHMLVDFAYNVPVLVHAFDGLDTGVGKMRPNWHWVGPAANRDNALEGASKPKDDQLNAWLDKQQKAQLKLIYVTMGTMAVLDEGQIQAIYQGLSAVPGTAVIWSIKAAFHKFLPGGQHRWAAAHVIRRKLPPAAGHSQYKLTDVKLVISRDCEWGGLMETCIAGKVILATPFFGDQPDNAAIVEKTGFGKILLPSKFTKESIQSKCTDLLANPSTCNAEKAKEVQEKVLATGGVPLMETIIEKNCVKPYKYEASPLRYYVGALIIAATALGAALYFTPAAEVPPLLPPAPPPNLFAAVAQWVTSPFAGKA
eukprot:5338168-Prymnesium_polylepis.1